MSKLFSSGSKNKSSDKESESDKNNNTSKGHDPQVAKIDYNNNVKFQNK